MRPSSRFLKIEFHLSKLGGFLRVHSRSKVGFLQEIAPARHSVLLALLQTTSSESFLRGLNSLDNGDNPTRLVGLFVKSNDCE